MYFVKYTERVRCIQCSIIWYKLWKTIAVLGQKRKKKLDVLCIMLTYTLYNIMYNKEYN
jgi:hypothetical protein